MRQDIQILSDNRLFPTVMNINQGQNKLDVALYSMENYVVNEVDLSTCDWYAVLMGVYGLDEVKLTHEVDEGVLKVRWDLNNYVTNIGQTLTYQIVAKNSDAAVYYTNKGIILNSQSIHADEFIVANYPSILRQWEEYMKDLSGISLDAYVIMDLDNYIPVNERVEGKFYLNRLTDYDYSCLIEDAKGNLITPSAMGISYDPTKTKLSAYNVQDALDIVAKRSSGTVKFCVNEGNLTNGSEDILSYSDNTLSFKVGGEYSNLIATKADNTMFERGALNDVDLQAYDDGVYKVCVDEDSTELTTGEIYTQLEQPENMQEGDIWFNGVQAVKYSNNENFTIDGVTISGSYNFSSVCYGNGTYIAVTNEGYILKSTDKINWSSVGEYYNRTLSRVKFVNNNFVVCGTLGTIIYSSDTQTWNEINVGVQTPIADVIYDGTKYVICGTSGVIKSSTNLTNWSDLTNFTSDRLDNICFGNNLYVTSTSVGKIYKSSDLITWTVASTGTEFRINSIKFLNNTFVYCGEGYLGRSTDGNTWARTYHNIIFRDVEYLQGKYIFVGASGSVYLTTNFSNLQLQTTNTTSVLLSIDEGVIVGSNTTILTYQNLSGSTPFTKVPLGEVVKEGGVITEVATYPYNVNGLTMASPTTFGVMRVAAPTDEIDCSCNDASITPANLYDLNNYRRVNAEYKEDDAVGCPYHHNLQLRCIVAGTTSSEALNTKGTLEPGTKIIDGTVTWEVEELGTGSGTGRNIGDIFYTSRLDDELNGAFECNGRRFSTEDFKGSQSIGKLLEAGSLPYVSLEEYESLVTDNGSCRAFGWDGETEFRVPTIPALLLTKEEAAVVGNGMALGITDGTDNHTVVQDVVGSNNDDYGLTASKSALGSPVGSASEGYASDMNGVLVGITTDPTKSGIVSNLNVIEYRAMVQLANEASDEALIAATACLANMPKITYWE